jgi:hypothetical protein
MTVETRAVYNWLLLAFESVYNEETPANIGRIRLCGERRCGHGCAGRLAESIGLGRPTDRVRSSPLFKKPCRLMISANVVRVWQSVCLIRVMLPASRSS